VKTDPTQKFPIRPLISEAWMQEILLSRCSITSGEFKKQVEAHLGRPLLPGRKPASFNGQTVWVSC